MDPTDFVKLTVVNQEQLEAMLDMHIIDGALDGTKEYDKFAMPMLRIGPNGRILEHDGRHRSVMVHQAGGNKFPVGIFFEGIKEMPPELHGQYTPSITVPTSRIRFAPNKQKDI